MSDPELSPQQLRSLKTLLENVGDAGVCRGCRAGIFWVRHRNGKAVPYDPTGLNHFTTCPQAALFHLKKGPQTA